MEPLITATIEKLNKEIADNSNLLLYGELVLLFLLSIVFIVSVISKELVLKEFMIMILVTASWFAARQESMIHNPGKYLSQLETAISEEDTLKRQQQIKKLGGWETWKDNLKFRPIILILSSLFGTSFVWFILFRMFKPHPFGSSVIIWGGIICFAIGIVMIPLAIKYADR